MEKSKEGDERQTARLTANQKFLLRLSSFPNRSLRILVQLDEQGQVVTAVLEDVGKVERYG